VDLGGTGLVFGVFAAFFVLAAAASWGLPERRGQRLDHAVPTPQS
jgi:putative MFS transporter